MRRPLLLLVAGLVAAVSLSGCGAAGDPAAATINGTHISRSDFQDELQVLADNKKFVSSLQKSQGIDITPTADSVSPEVSSQWLNLLINQSIVDAAFHKRNLEVDPQTKAQAEQQAASVFGGAESFAAFPKWFQDTMVGRQERVAALSAALPPFQPAAADVEQYFNERMQCATNQLIEHILVPTEADANAIEAQLAAGADFATLARQRSTDSASAAVGGALWCSASQEFVNADKDFQNGALAITVGQTSPPVKSQFGYHVIRIVPWNFANVRALAEQQYTRQVENPLSRLINAALLRADLWVDPRYGDLKHTGGTVVVEPPKAPNPKSRPPASTTPSSVSTPSP